MNPSYQIRSIPANASDQLFCSILAQSAVHGAMAGYTGFTTGLINTHFCLIPLHLIVNKTRAKVDVGSRMWNRLITATGQPILSGTSGEEATASADLTSPSTPATSTRSQSVHNGLDGLQLDAAGLQNSDSPGSSNGANPGGTSRDREAILGEAP
jgi:hypothetical protein